MAISKREAAKKIASKVKTKTKSKRNLSVERYQSQGQGNPQSKAWTEPNDEGVAAKPIGWRWTNLGASKLGKNPDSRPSNADVKAYASKSFKVKGETHRYLYTEKRVDKSDKNRSAKFYAGGTMGAGTFEDGGTVGAGTFKKGGKTKELELLVDSHYGVYVPQVFVENYDLKDFGFNDKDIAYFKKAFSDSQSDDYFDAYEKMESKAITKDGSTITTADGNLWLVPKGYNYDDLFYMKKGGATFGGRQYDPYSEDADGQKIAKPIGYRFTDKLAKRLGKSEHSRPTAQEVEKYSGRGVYFEARQDKADAKPSKKFVSLEYGGDMVGAGSFRDGGDVRQKGSQSGNPTRSLDKAHQAKPVGFRFRGNKYRRPSEQHIRQQLKLSPADRDIYKEVRKDKSDYSFEARLENGGDIEGAGMFKRGGSTQYVPNDMIESITLSNGRVIKNDRIYDGAYVSKSLKLENGGGIEGAGMFARGGGVERVANSQSRDYSENLIPFKGANLEGKTLDNGDYVVLSYGYYPIWWYCKAEGKWYGNSTKYSVTTSKQMTQSRPTYDAKMVTKNELTDLMMKHHARFEDGGMLDGILGDTGAATTNGVGGTSFSSLDLTSQMDLTNPAF